MAAKTLTLWVNEPIFLLLARCRTFELTNQSKFPPFGDIMTLSDRLRSAVTSSKRTRYAIALGAGIDHAVLRRFMNKERDIKLKTAESLAEYLDLELVKKKKKG